MIRESYRVDGKVKNKTVANISPLPPLLIENIRQFLSGTSGDFSVAALSIGQTYEYGASFALKSLATKIGLDKAIFSTKTQWREDVMAV